MEDVGRAACSLPSPSLYSPKHQKGMPAEQREATNSIAAAQHNQHLQEIELDPCARHKKPPRITPGLSTSALSERLDYSTDSSDMKRWRRRLRFWSAALLLVFLMFGGGLVLQGLWRPIQKNQKKLASQELQATKTVSNSTIMISSPNENLISSLDDSLEREFKDLNISSSGEVRAATILKDEPYSYILNEPHACLLRAPFLVLLIAVEPKRTDAREAIRKTWGNESVAGDLGFVRLFLIGVNKDTQDKGSSLQKTIEDESRKHHDVIQQDYKDVYKNLTIKTLMGMYWITKFCPEATYVMKTDSDMFVNTEYLIKKILKAKGHQTQRYFTGHLMSDFTPNRHNQSKWYMPPELYPGARYPTFCSGTGYVFSADMAKKIYVTSLSVPRLHLEDVYVGVCLSKLKIEPVPPSNEHIFNHWRVPYSSCKYSSLITSHGFHPHELIQYWKHLQSNKQNPCRAIPHKPINKSH
ncbi:hypothetical protein DNTS_035586 [Danionella cerebrum]|uniref:Hexosyltransferase n=1 Tax=Danionella cerebrum TaxID=2873325 RepID=A0A553NKY9_9TELE|nr:hypothetical protein DNTS_035586 [Danionella translucida]